jgi:hypothetical protein
MLNTYNISINRTLQVVARVLLPKGHAAGASMRHLTHLTVAAIAGCLATSVPVLGEELEIPHTRVATAGMSGGFQCANGPSIYYNPNFIQAASCSLNTLTYTWGGRRVAMFDFNLSGIPEDADIEAAFVRLEGVCCYGYAEWFELSMMPGIGSFNTSVANQVYETPGEIVPHPPHNPDPEHGDYDVDLELMESIRAGTNWLLVGIDRSGSFTNLAASATLHVSYSLGPPCDGDLNNDDVVDGGDVSLVLGYWGTASALHHDLDGNGLVDGADLAVVLGEWGPCPE